MEEPSELEEHYELETDLYDYLTKEDFEEALAAYSSRTWFVCWIFILSFTATILNGFHVMSYVFYSVSPKHWCSIPVLEKANWTPEQIRAVSSPSPDEFSNCEYYDWNYEELRDMGYESALQKVKADKKPDTIFCTRYSYEIEHKDSSFVPEWNMVCHRLVMKATVQTAVSFGKFIGAFVFGILADKYGRKMTFDLSCLIYIITGPVIAWTDSYIIMVICRIGLGVAGIGVYQAAYSILIEISPPNKRSAFGVMFNMSYPIGMILIAVIAYHIREWRLLQLYISLPSFILILHMLAMPESPRWLYYSNHKKKAWKMMRNVVSPEKRKMIDEQRISIIAEIQEKTSRYKQFKKNIRYFRYFQMNMRLLLCWFIWFSTSMAYYVLSIISGHLKINSYLYTGLSGIAEGISYIIVIPMLQMIGRRGTSFILLLCSAISFSVLLVLPDIENIQMLKDIKMSIALLGRLCVSSVFVAVIIHCSELFPTVIRNVAIGSSSTCAHIGSTLAPYLVDYFIIYGWWVPNGVCGLTTFISALFTQVFPETRHLALYDTMDEFFSRCKANPRERLSFKNSLVYSLLRKLHIVRRPTPMIVQEE